jgi:hypothetical protein
MKNLWKELQLTCVLLLLIAMVLPAPAPAQEEESEVPEALSMGFKLGYHHINVNGYRGKVGEYEVLDPGMEGTFILDGNRGRNYFGFEGVVRDEDDMDYALDVDAERLLQTETSYNRFQHYLDHDPLTNQDFVSDFDVGKDNVILWEELTSKNTFWMPLLPGVKIEVDYRQMNKRGHRQATTVAKCTRCHVTSNNRRVDQSTEDVRVGVEARLKSVTLNYFHFERTFDEGGRAPIAFYGNESATFPVKNFNFYGQVPDARTVVDEIKLSANLPAGSTFFGSYRWGKQTNRNTHNDRDFSNLAFRLTSFLRKLVAVNVYYSNYTMNNDVRDAMDLRIRRTGMDVSSRWWRKTTLRTTYYWEDIDRRNFVEESTLKKVFNVALFSRLYPKIDFNIRYRKDKIDDPFVAEERGPGLFKLTQTSLPRTRDEVYASVNWNLRADLSLNSTFRYEDMENPRYDVDENRYEFVLSLWYSPTETLVFTGSYNLIDSEIDTRRSTKTYHVRDLKDILVEEMPYDDRSQTFLISANYRWTPQLALTGDLRYTDSRSDFDAQEFSSNVGDFSKHHIEQIGGSLELDYIYGKRMTFFAKYAYRQYNDREENFLDGEFHLMNFGVKYSF